MILNDVLVYKAGSCEALLDVALCQSAGPGIRCVWVNERCVSWDSSHSDGNVPASFCPERSSKYLSFANHRFQNLGTVDKMFTLLPLQSGFYIYFIFFHLHVYITINSPSPLLLYNIFNICLSIQCLRKNNPCKFLLKCTHIFAW